MQTGSSEYSILPDDGSALSGLHT